MAKVSPRHRGVSEKCLRRFLFATLTSSRGRKSFEKLTLSQVEFQSWILIQFLARKCQENCIKSFEFKILQDLFNFNKIFIVFYLIFVVKHQTNKIWKYKYWNGTGSTDLNVQVLPLLLSPNRAVNTDIVFGGKIMQYWCQIVFLSLFYLVKISSSELRSVYPPVNQPGLAGKYLSWSWENIWTSCPHCDVIFNKDDNMSHNRFVRICKKYSCRQGLYFRTYVTVN